MRMDFGTKLCFEWMETDGGNGKTDRILLR